MKILKNISPIQKINILKFLRSLFNTKNNMSLTLEESMNESLGCEEKLLKDRFLIFTKYKKKSL